MFSAISASSLQLMNSNRKWYGAGTAGVGGRRGFSTAGATLNMNHYHYYDRHSGGANKFASNTVLLFLIGFFFFTAQFIIVSKINPDSLMNPKHHKSKYSALENLDTGGRNFLINKHMKEHENHAMEARHRRERETQKEASKPDPSNEEVKSEEAQNAGDSVLGNRDAKKLDVEKTDADLNAGKVDPNSAAINANFDENPSETDSRIDRNEPKSKSNSVLDDNTGETLESNEPKNEVAHAKKAAETVHNNAPDSQSDNSASKSEGGGKNAAEVSETNEDAVGNRNLNSKTKGLSNSEHESEAQPRPTEQTNEKMKNSENSIETSDEMSEHAGAKEEELTKNFKDLPSQQSVLTSELKDSTERKAILDEPSKQIDIGSKIAKHSPEEI